MTFTPLNALHYGDFSAATKIQDMEKEQSDFLRIWRLSLKARAYQKRSVLSIHPFLRQVISAPICPVCRKMVTDPEMHEVIITRGMSRHLPFEVAINIFWDWNIVLLHPGCHARVQSHPVGRHICIRQILRYEKAQDIWDWLDWFESQSVSVGREARYYLQSLSWFPVPITSAGV